MTQLITFLRSGNYGDNVVCLHSCLGSSRQWLSLMTQLEDSFCVTSIDLYGYGKGPQWNLDESLSLDDEVDLIAPMLDSMSGPIHLVGHSYGAAVAIKVAQRYAHKIQSLTVYEPVLFTLLFAAGRNHRAASEIFQVVEDMQRDYRLTDSNSATRRFIDYWSGEGAWNQFNPELQSGMSAKAGMVLANFEALMSERNLFTTLRNLDVPTLCLHGEKSPDTTIEIADILAALVPNIEVRKLSGMGHMGPITHRDRVNQQIECFLLNQTSVNGQVELIQAA